MIASARRRSLRFTSLGASLSTGLFQSGHGLSFLNGWQLQAGWCHAFVLGSPMSVPHPGAPDAPDQAPDGLDLPRAYHLTELRVAHLLLPVVRRHADAVGLRGVVHEEATRVLKHHGFVFAHDVLRASHRSGQLRFDSRSTTERSSSVSAP